MTDSIQIIEIIRRAGFEPIEYTPRGRADRSCVGVILQDRRSFAQIIRAAGDCDTAADLFEAHSTDELGRGDIAYWPGFDWIETDESGLEPDDDCDDIEGTE